MTDTERLDWLEQHLAIGLRNLMWDYGFRMPINDGPLRPTIDACMRDMEFAKSVNSGRTE